MKLIWQKLNKRGQRLEEYRDEPGPDGVWVASLKLPYKDSTVQLWSWDGVMQKPIVCHGGQEVWFEIPRKWAGTTRKSIIQELGLSYD